VPDALQPAPGHGLPPRPRRLRLRPLPLPAPALLVPPSPHPSTNSCPLPPRAVANSGQPPHQSNIICGFGPGIHPNHENPVFAIHRFQTRRAGTRICAQPTIKGIGIVPPSSSTAPVARPASVSVPSPDGPAAPPGGHGAGPRSPTAPPGSSAPAPASSPRPPTPPPVRGAHHSLPPLTPPDTPGPLSAMGCPSNRYYTASYFILKPFCVQSMRWVDILPSLKNRSNTKNS